MSKTQGCMNPGCGYFLPEDLCPVCKAKATELESRLSATEAKLSALEGVAGKLNKALSGLQLASGHFFEDCSNKEDRKRCQDASFALTAYDSYRAGEGKP